VAQADNVPVVQVDRDRNYNFRKKIFLAQADRNRKSGHMQENFLFKKAFSHLIS